LVSAQSPGAEIMETVFLICAVVGGTVMLLQLALTIFGIGGHHASGCGSMDAGGHVGDLGGSHGHLTGGDHASAHDSVHDSSHDSQHDSTVDDRASDHGSLWIFKLLSFQTLAAAIAFFGIGGSAALAAEFDPAQALVIAIVAGGAAMYVVYHMVRLLHRFNADGTLRIANAVGLPATVYLPIPAAGAGAGKIQMKLQNRIIEFQATTMGERLPCGASVKVVGLVDSDTVAVEPLVQSETVSHV
jgi:hypothetical protein